MCKGREMYLLYNLPIHKYFFQRKIQLSQIVPSESVLVPTNDLQEKAMVAINR